MLRAWSKVLYDGLFIVACFGEFKTLLHLLSALLLDQRYLAAMEVIMSGSYQFIKLHCLQRCVSCAGVFPATLTVHIDALQTLFAGEMVYPLAVTFARISINMLFIRVFGNRRAGTLKCIAPTAVGHG